MNTFRFADPAFLALLLLVPLVVWWRARERAPAIIYSSLEGLRSLPKSPFQRFKPFLAWFELAGLVLIVLALARPEGGRQEIRLQTQGVALQLVIDRSGSMLDLDLDRDRFDRRDETRLDLVKAVIEDFLDEGGALPGRPNDVLGLVTFAGFAQAHTPLTLDHAALIEVLRTIESPEAIQGPRSRDHQMLNATAMGDGLFLAVQRMSAVPARSKVLVLLSDGASNTGVVTPKAAAESAREAGIKVYTIGIGTRGRGLDEETLEEVAGITGGRYFNVRRAADLAAVYGDIDALERSEIDVNTATRWRDLSAYVLAVALALLAVHRLLVLTRFRSLP